MEDKMTYGEDEYDLTEQEREMLELIEGEGGETSWHYARLASFDRALVYEVLRGLRERKFLRYHPEARVTVPPRKIAEEAWFLTPRGERLLKSTDYNQMLG
jgi:hypothetical protein